MSSAGIGPVEIGEPFSAYEDQLDDDAREQLEWCPVLFLDEWDDEVHEGWGMVAEGDSEDERVIAQIVVGEGGQNVAQAATAEGVGLDSTADDVRAAYPSARRTEGEILDSPPPYNLVIERDGVPIAFEISSDSDEVIGVAVGTEVPAYEYCG